MHPMNFTCVFERNKRLIIMLTKQNKTKPCQMSITSVVRLSEGCRRLTCWTPYIASNQPEPSKCRVGGMVYYGQDVGIFWFSTLPFYFLHVYVAFVLLYFMYEGGSRISRTRTFPVVNQKKQDVHVSHSSRSHTPRQPSEGQPARLL